MIITGRINPTMHRVEVRCECKAVESDLLTEGRAEVHEYEALREHREVTSRNGVLWNSPRQPSETMR